jgi:hypothetical protein
VHDWCLSELRGGLDPVFRELFEMRRDAGFVGRHPDERDNLADPQIPITPDTVGRDLLLIGRDDDLDRIARATVLAEQVVQPGKLFGELRFTLNQPSP